MEEDPYRSSRRKTAMVDSVVLTNTCEESLPKRKKKHMVSSASTRYCSMSQRYTENQYRYGDTTTNESSLSYIE